MRTISKNVINKISAILLIIALTISDVMFVGVSAVSYAIDIMETNNNNVEFSAYFLNSNGEKVEKIEEHIDNPELYLYVDVVVKNEGYLNEGKITLENNNFNIKQEKVNSNIKEISGNEVKIGQVNAGSTMSVKLPIEAKQEQTTTESALNTKTEVSLEGQYINSKNVEKKKHVDIKGKANVELNWKSKEQTKAELETMLLTNSIYEMNGEQKRVVQILIDSKITDNNYPVKNTTITSKGLEDVQKVSVQARSTSATNSKINFTEDNYEYNNQNKQITIKLSNEDAKNIDWSKEAQDTFVITYILDKDVDIIGRNIEINSQINTYDDKNLSQTQTVNIDQELDGIISASTQSKEDEIYKGKIYTGEERDYNTTNKININDINDTKNITLKINEAKYLANQNEMPANIVFKETKIKKEEFLKIFGEEGYITIKNTEGTVIANINKDTEIDENGKVIINYLGETKSIEVETSKPINVGTLNLENTKTILNSKYNREVIDSLTAIKENVSVNNIESTKNITLKDTQTVADLEMDVKTISTTADSTSLTLAAVLQSEDESKDLYKNPNLTVTFPREITIMSAQYKALYKNGLEIQSTSTTKNDKGEQQINISLVGEQQKYDGAGRTIIYLKLELNTSKLTPSKKSSINMTYSNQYKNVANSVNEEFEFESQYGLMIYNQILDYNNNGDNIVTIDQDTVKGTINTRAPEKEITLGTALINNYGQTVSNVTLLGTIPSEDNENGYRAMLNNIQTNINNAKISYSTTPNAKIDDKNWGDNIRGALSYKVEIPSMEAEQVVQLKADITLPENIPYNRNGEFLTEATCDIQEQERKNNTKIILSTNANILTSASAENGATTQNTESGLTAKINTLLGNNILSEGDNIYKGETLKYQITITNNSGKDYSNVKINANQKNGYVWDIIEREQYNPHYEKSFMQKFYELTDKNDIELATIESLKNGESYTFEYDTTTYNAGNKDLDGEETFGTISIVSQNNELNEEIETIKNKLKDGELELSIKDSDTIEINKIPGEEMRYTLSAKNITDKTLNNVEVKFIYSGDLNTKLGILEEGVILKNTEKNKDGTSTVTLQIKSIESGKTIEIFTSPYTNNEIDKDEENTWVLAQAITENNNSYISNIAKRIIYDNSYNITVEQKALYEDGREINIEKDKLNNGDKVNFITTITNNEKEDLDLDLTYNVDEMVQIEKAEILNRAKVASIPENLSLISCISGGTQTIKPGEKVTISILGSVNATNTDSITNVLKTYNDDRCKSVNSEMTLAVNKLQEPIDDEKEEPQKPGKAEGDVDPDETQPEEDPEDRKPSVENPERPNQGDNKPSTIIDNNDDDSEYNYEGDYDQDAKRHTISGTVWIDHDRDGKRGTSERTMDGITIKAIDVETGETTNVATTNSSGVYTLNLPEGNYILVSYYNSDLYTTTIYQADGVSDEQNSDVIERQINVDGEDITAGTTDIIDLNSDIKGIDVGMYLRSIFDLNVQKYVSKITTTTEKGTNTYEQPDGTTLAKAEIKSKYLNDSLVVVEYKIKVSNTGDVAGYATNIVDYMPSTLDFNSSLNPDWYISGENLYNTSLANTKIEAGETKELTLVLTKTMTESNTGLINNKAEISESSNPLGIEDQTKDTGSADIIISVSTGALVSYVITTLTTLIVLAGIAYVINKKYLIKKV